MERRLQERLLPEHLGDKEAVVAADAEVMLRSAEAHLHTDLAKCVIERGGGDDVMVRLYVRNVKYPTVLSFKAERLDQQEPETNPTER